jgi:flagellar biosynthesis/type III secretory pathway protein FliH
MTLSDKETSLSWRSNELLTGDKASSDFTAFSWSNGGSKSAGAGFTKWEAKKSELLGPTEEIGDAGTPSEPPKEALDTTKKDEPEALTVSMAVLDQAKQDFFEKGYSRGVEEAERKWESTRETFSALTQSIYQEQKKATTFFEPLKILSLHIAQQLVRGELSISSVAIERLIRGVLEEIQQKGPASIVISLSPEDFDKVCSNLSEDLAHVDFRKNDNLSPGSVVLALDDSAVEDLIEHRLGALSESLFTVVSTNNVSESNTSKELSEEEESEHQPQVLDTHLTDETHKPVDEVKDA